jgi:ribosomal protein S18 acetylase RimI-like enzyme
MIRPATPQDIPAIAAIDAASFSGNKTQQAAERWIHANFAQDDKYRYFVAEDNGMIDGYIGWEIKGGFMRKAMVVELERLAVAETARGHGIGTTLVNDSFHLVKSWIRELRPDAKVIKVFAWTKKNNEGAVKIYGKICPELRGSRNIYDTDEVMLYGEHQL